MSWWAIIYLMLFWGLFAIGIVDNMRTGKAVYRTILDLISAVLVTVFTYLYFIPLATIDYKEIILSAVSLGLCWEIYGAHIDLQNAKTDEKLSEQENEFLKWIGAATAIVLILPGYIFGVLICLNQ